MAAAASISRSGPATRTSRLAYICDIDTKVGNERCEEIAKKHGRKPKYVQDLRKMLDDKSVDVVSIATPNHWHSLAAIWAMQAGKDVYVEKPVSHNVSEGRRDRRRPPRSTSESARPARKAARSPGMHEAIEYLQAGKIGEVKLARGLCYKPRGSIGPKGNYPSPEGRRLRSVERAGADQAAHAPQVPLRLALAMGLRQRRHGQPGHPPDGHRPLGLGRRRRCAERASATAAGSAMKTPAKRQHAGGDSRLRRQDARVRGPRAEDPRPTDGRRSA